VPDAAPAAPAPGAKSVPRFSAWHIVGIVAGVLAVAAVACSVGATIGFGYGRATTLAVSAFRMRDAMMPYGLSPFGDDNPVPFGFGNEVPYGMMGPQTAAAAYLGVGYEEVRADVAQHAGLAEGEGALVTTVIEGSPAAKAGVQVGDIILEVDGQRIVRTALLRRVIQGHVPGDGVTLLVLRGATEESLDVVLGQASDAPAP
jgi:membrane-associated protease RseP (regulator of RpoE activity)